MVVRFHRAAQLIGDDPQGFAEALLVGGGHRFGFPLNLMILIGIANRQIVFGIEQR